MASAAVLSPWAARAGAPQGVVHSMPAAGRGYEILVPPAPAEQLRNLPLVVYLHPAADPQLDRARRDYWPILAKRKCLMALPRGKSEKMWLAGEEKYVTDVVADVQTRYSVDAGRIILLGVSGGGQVALFLADHLPESFRAVIAVSTNPVVIRGRRQAWFYPDPSVLKSCPYFVVNHITQGWALMYWRQVRAKLAPAGASISILPVTGEVGEYQPPPEPLGPWLDEVLAGRHPAALADPQAAAVAKMFREAVAALPAVIAKAAAGPGGEKFDKQGKVLRLSAAAPADFERAGGEAETDSTGAPLTQIRIEHKKWPISVRCDARATQRPMQEVLTAEEKTAIERGVLYQVYHSGQVTAGRRDWKYRIGSITYPDRRRGWVSALFIHAAAPVGADPRRWLTVTVTDETQQPQAQELAGTVKTVLQGIAAAATPPATTRAAGGG